MAGCLIARADARVRTLRPRGGPLTDAHQQAARDDRRESLAEADVGVQILERLLAAALDQLIPGFGRNRQRHEPEGQQFLAQQPLAELRRFLVPHGAQEVADLAARAAGLDVVQPGRIRCRLRRRDDLDHVAVAQLGAQRDQILIDARRRAMMANVGVHVVGKIDHRRAARHGHDLAFGGEYVNVVGKEVDLDVLEELGRIAALHFEKRLQPLVRPNVQFAAAVFVILVEPVVQPDYTKSRQEATSDKGMTPANYKITRELLMKKAKSDAILLHSLPRMDEIPTDVDITHWSRYWQEAFNGVVMRMALLALVLGKME